MISLVARSESSPRRLTVLTFKKSSALLFPTHGWAEYQAAILAAMGRVNKKGTLFFLKGDLGATGLYSLDAPFVGVHCGGFVGSTGEHRDAGRPRSNDTRGGGTATDLSCGMHSARCSCPPRRDEIREISKSLRLRFDGAHRLGGTATTRLSRTPLSGRSFCRISSLADNLLR